MFCRQSTLIGALLLALAAAPPTAIAHGKRHEATPHPTATPTASPTAPAARDASPGSPAGPSVPQEVWGCPMDEEVRQDHPGTCPRCGMDLQRMDAQGKPFAAPAVPEGAESPSTRPLMPGVPNWMIFTFALLSIVVSFVLFEVAGRRPRESERRHRFDLFRIPGMRRLMRHRLFPAMFQLPMVLAFILVVAAGLFGNPAPERNIAPILTWTIWWAWLVIVIVFLGKVWCTICPWMTFAVWARRLGLGQERRWPAALRNIWVATGLFVFLTWLELGYGVTEKPWLTAVLGLLMAAMAVATAAFFERNAFCRYACLVGRVSGLYSMFASTELRAADRAKCRCCATKDCYRGNQMGAACPTHQFLGAMDQNTYCILCMECVKSCPEDNVAWNARPWAADLLESPRPRVDEAFLSVIMLSMSAFHGLTMTPSWDRVVDGTSAMLRIGWLAAFSTGMAGILVAPFLVYWGLCALMRALSGDERHGTRTLFVHFAYSLLPIALFYHLAHNVQHIVFEGKKLVRVLSDPFGFGWDLFGTAHFRVDVLLPLAATWGIQVSLILIGNIYGILIAHRVARDLYGPSRAATWSQIPMLIGILLFSFQSLWLLSQPMLMRTAM